jgi:hypothetical protein
MKPNQWNPKHLTQIQSIFPKNGEGFWFHYWFWWPGEMTIRAPQEPSKNNWKYVALG